jgi:hypothetical protein
MRPPLNSNVNGVRYRVFNTVVPWSSKSKKCASVVKAGHHTKFVTFDLFDYVDSLKKHVKNECSE